MSLLQRERSAIFQHLDHKFFGEEEELLKEGTMVLVFMVDHQEVTFTLEVLHRYTVKFPLLQFILYGDLGDTRKTLTVHQNTLDRLGMPQFEEDIEVIDLIFDIVKEYLSGS